MGKGQETMRERGGREVGGSEVVVAVVSSTLPAAWIGDCLWRRRGLTLRDMPNSGEW